MDRLAELDVEASVMAQLDTQETPLRIQSQRKTYYVLTVEQIAALMQPLPTVEDNESFTPEDFGLTEKDVENYLARRQEREQQIGAADHMPISTELKNRLDMLRTLSDLSPSAVPVDKQTLRVLEEAMLRNLQISVRNAS